MVTKEDKELSDRWRWIILALAYLCMLCFAFTFQSVPPVLPLIISDLRLTRAEGGLLMSLFSMPAILLAILGGSLLDRYGTFKIGIICLVLTIIGNLMLATSSSFLYIGLGRFISGAGGVIVSLMAVVLVSQWFRDLEMGMAMGIYNTAIPAGAILSLTTFGVIGESSGWRIPILIITLLCIVGLAAFVLLHRPPRKKGNTTKEGFFSLVSLRKIGVSVWLLGLCWMWFNAAIISFLTFGPDFFVLKGYSIGTAGLLTGLLLMGPLTLGPLIGHFIDKFNNNELFIGVGGLGLAVAFWLIAMATVNFILILVIMAVFTALVPTSVFSLTPRISSPENQGLSFGILSAVMNVGVFFGPYVTGLIRDRTASYEGGFITLSIFAVILTITTIILKISIKKTPR